MPITTFEQALDLLESASSDPWTLMQHTHDLVAGLRNLQVRLALIEKTRLEDRHRMQGIEGSTAEERAELAAVAKDRTDLQHRVDDLEREVKSLRDEQAQHVAAADKAAADKIAADKAAADKKAGRDPSMPSPEPTPSPPPPSPITNTSSAPQPNV